MIELLQKALDLFSQLIEIGAEHTEVLIAGMVLVVCIGVAVVLFCVAVVLSLPFMIIACFVKLVILLYRWRHPVYEYDEYNYEEPEEFSTEAPQTGVPPNELPPVYPDWMKQKGGRLL